MSSQHPFNETALRFCSLIERPERVTLRRLQLALLELYAGALLLRPGAPTPPVPGQRARAAMSRRWKRRLWNERYFEVFDATKNTAPLHGWLYDDVRDIHLDVRRALCHGDARTMFRCHWGAHCADALRALHWKRIGMRL